VKSPATPETPMSAVGLALRITSRRLYETRRDKVLGAS
jgi:hypothetical protein